MRHLLSTSCLEFVDDYVYLYVVYASYRFHDRSEKMFSVFVPRHRRVAKSKILGHHSVFMLSGLPDHPDLTW